MEHTKTRRLHRLISAVLAAAMLLTLCPPVAWAADPVATVEINGETFGYNNITDAWNAAQNADSATITVLKEITLDAALTLEKGDVSLKIESDAGLSSNSNAIIEITGGKLTLCNDSDGDIGSEAGTGTAIRVSSGEFVMDGGYIMERCGIEVQSGSVCIKGGAIGGSETGLLIHGGTVKISGGAFGGFDGAYAIHRNDGGSVRDLLEADYTYIDYETSEVYPDEVMDQSFIEGTAMVVPVRVQITSQPADAERTYGDDTEVSATVKASVQTEGSYWNTLLYQWYKEKTDEEGVYELIQGAESDTYTLPGDTNAGSYSVYCQVKAEKYPDATAIPEYKYIIKSKPATLTVHAKNIAGATITLATDSYTYDGSRKTPDVTAVVLDGETLVKGTDYEVTYSNNTDADKAGDAGAPAVVITGKGNYTGTASAAFTIAPAPLGKPESLACTDAQLTWDAVPNAAGYRVTAYQNDVKTEQAVTVPEASCDLNAFKGGEYTFTVQAVGEGNYCDGEESGQSEPVHVHTWGEPEWTWDTTDSENPTATAAVVCQDEPGHTHTAKADILCEIVPPTATEAGRKVYHATVQLNGETYTDEYTVTLPATGTTEGGGSGGSSDAGGSDGSDDWAALLGMGIVAGVIGSYAAYEHRAELPIWKLNGVVRQAGGAPLANAAIELVKDGQTVRTLTADEAGAFSARVPQGSYEAVITWQQGGATHTRRTTLETGRVIGETPVQEIVVEPESIPEPGQENVVEPVQKS